MYTKVLNYRIVVQPDRQTGTNKKGYTAYCPTLGIADDGDTVEEALSNVTGAIKTYVDSLAEDKLSVPHDETQKDIITTTQIQVSDRLQFT